MESKFLRKIVLTSVVILTCQSFVQAQSAEPSALSANTLYFDMSLGLLTQVSINYEYQISSREKVSWYARGGVVAGFLLPYDLPGYGGLAAATMLTGKKDNHFELNMGIMVAGNQEGVIPIPLLTVGYRYQKPEGGFIFRANGGLAYVGVSFGHAF